MPTLELTSNQIVHNAWKAGVAIPAFNIPYRPMIEPVAKALAAQDGFGFIMVARLEWIKFESGSPAAIHEEYLKWRNPRHTRLHLDHVPVIDEDHLQVDYVREIGEAIDIGYDSVMVDASRLDLAGNIAATATIAGLAHKAGIACEAELGAVMGHEAGPLPPYDELFASGKGFTAVDEAVRFVHETGCDWLSVAIGSVHGAISAGLKDQKKVAARLNLEHLDKLREATQIPLVLHGGSGIRQEYVLESFKRGIAKLNIATEIRQAWEQALRETGQIEKAQTAVYDRTCWLLSDYFKLAGIRAAVTGAE